MQYEKLVELYISLMRKNKKSNERLLNIAYQCIERCTVKENDEQERLNQLSSELDNISSEIF